MSQKNPAEMYFEKANNLYESSEYEEALEYLNKALSIDSEYIDALLMKGNIFLNIGNFPNALGCYDAAFKLDNLCYDALTAKGSVYKGLGKYETAIEYFDRALSINSEYLEALNEKASALASLGKYDEAMDCINKVLRISPNNKYALNNKGVIYFDREEYENAINIFDEVLKIDPRFHYALYNKAKSLFNIGNFSKSTKIYNKLLRLYPEDVISWYEKGLAHENLNQYKKAYKSYNNALEYNPIEELLVEILYHKGNICIYLNKYKSALKLFDDLLEMDSQYVNAWNDKGVAQEKLKQFKEAYVCYKKALKFKPNEVIILCNVGNMCIELNKPKEALKFYNKVLEIDSDYADAWDGKGMAVYLLEIEDPMPFYKEALKKNPNHSSALYNIAYLLYTKRDYKNSLDYLDKSLKANNENADSWNLKGVISSDQGKSNNALLCYDKTLEIDSLYPYVWANKGLVFEYDLKDYEKAVECYNGGLKINSKDENALCGKARVFRKLGKNHQARVIEWRLSDPEIKRICLERNLEDKLANDLSLLEKHGYNLELIGRQKSCMDGKGRFDLFCREKNTNEYIVIELKNVMAGKETYYQILNYIKSLGQTYTDKLVRGLVISRGHDKEFENLLKSNEMVNYLHLEDLGFK